MKTIFITGASTGLGKATAVLFQSKGWKVIATMRNPENGNELKKLDNIIVLPLDVTNVEQINTTVAEVIAKHEIDVVFNNAGYGISGALEATSDEQILKQIDTNLLGVIRITKAFIPYFREKAKGLFISTTSIGGIVGFPFSSLYHATKWGLEGWSESMSFELGKLGIGIKTVAPGGIATDFFSRSYDWALHPAYQQWVDRFISNVDGAVFAPAEEIAAVVYEAATDGKDQVRYLAGDGAKGLFQKHEELGKEGFRKFMGEAFLGD